MPTLKNLLVILVVSFHIPSVMAAAEFEESIPIEVAAALFDMADMGRFAAYSDIMDEFPPFLLPTGFSVMGSAVNGPYLKVALKTQLSAEEATEAIVSSFANNGWGTIPSPFGVRRQTGFVAADVVTPIRTQMCHDELRLLTITYSERDTSNLVVLNKAYGLSGRPRTCAQVIAEIESLSSMRTNRGGINQYLPKLEVPDSLGANVQPGFIGGTSSSSSRGMEVDAYLELDWTIDEVYAHFAEQITDQEWELDTESVGNISATGTWVLNPEPDVNLVGTFTVMDSGDSNYQMKFRMVSTDGNSGGGGGISSIVVPR